MKKVLKSAELSLLIRVEREETITAMSVTAVSVPSNGASIKGVEQNSNPKRGWSTLLSRGSVEVVPHKHFHVCVSDPIEETRLPKDMIVAQGNNTVACLTTVDNMYIKKETVNAAPLNKPRTAQIKSFQQLLQAKRDD